MHFLFIEINVDALHVLLLLSSSSHNIRHLFSRGAAVSIRLVTTGNKATTSYSGRMCPNQLPWR